MKIIVLKNEVEVANYAKDMIVNQIRTNPKTILGLATGGTPLLCYQALVQDYQIHQTNYQHVQTFNLDEYLDLDPSHSQSYRSFMNTNLFDHMICATSQTYMIK